MLYVYVLPPLQLAGERVKLPIKAAWPFGSMSKNVSPSKVSLVKILSPGISSNVRIKVKTNGFAWVIASIRQPLDQSLEPLKGRFEQFDCG